MGSKHSCSRPTSVLPMLGYVNRDQNVAASQWMCFHMNYDKQSELTHQYLSCSSPSPSLQVLVLVKTHHYLSPRHESKSSRYSLSQTPRQCPVLHSGAFKDLTYPHESIWMYGQVLVQMKSLIHVWVQILSHSAWESMNLCGVMSSVKSKLKSGCPVLITGKCQHKTVLSWLCRKLNLW